MLGSARVPLLCQQCGCRKASRKTLLTQLWHTARSLTVGVREDRFLTGAALLEGERPLPCGRGSVGRPLPYGRGSVWDDGEATPLRPGFGKMSMKRDEWTRITELFSAAIEREPDPRSTFLDRACADQPDLRTHVEKLIADDEDVARTDFLSPLPITACDLLASDE